jgi:1-deoxy-D-xylulose-5-phosphate reductoisomerase
MKIPIQYALTHPDRLPLDEKKFNLEDVGKLTFEKLDHDRFPALKLAMRVLDKGGIAPAVMNVVNEYAVYAFLERKISFPEIVEFSAEAVERVYAVANPDIEDIFNAAEWGKEFVRKKLG